MGDVIKADLISSKDFKHSGVKSNLKFLHMRAVMGLVILLKSLINLLQNPACPRKLLTSFTVIGAVNQS